MGHSAGAQLVALVSVDGQFLREAGQSTEIIKRTIVLDGIYDLPYRLRTDDEENKQAIHQSFGRNPIILRAASPSLVIKKSPRTYTPPAFAMRDTRKRRGEELKFYRAEVYLSEGGQDYDLMGWSKEQIITDVIDHYEKHMHFLHLMR